MARAEGSKIDNMDDRFALVDTDGVERYPYRIKKQDGRFGFVLGQDRHGQGEVVETIEEVVRAVVLDGKRVRTSDYPPSTAKGSNGVSLAARQEIQGYRIDPSLAYLVASAAVAPLGRPQGRPKSSDVGSTSTASAASKTSHSLARLDAMPVENFQSALERVEPEMTSPQKEMLRSHANADAAELSMQAIAEHGGYVDYASANAQYGRLGRLFAEALGLEPDSLENKVQAICVSAGRNDSLGHFVWRIRPQLEQALHLAGWIEPEPAVAGDLALAGAAADIASDATTNSVPETTRKALINARVGQGGFRLRMLKVWDAKCAVTGLGVADALVASHAKAWKHCDNAQRLDEFNGLLLAATVDKLFDKGLISFADDGRLLTSSKVTDADLGLAGLSPSARLQTLPARCVPYLKAHRAQHGFNEA